MTKKGLYMLSVVACASGYVWLAASSMHAEEGVWRGCLFKQFSIFLVLRVVLHGLS